MREVIRKSSSADELPGVLDYLRVTTRHVHRELERRPSLRRLIAPDQRRAEYVDLLASLHGYHHVLENALLGCRRKMPSFDYRWQLRYTTLAMDIADMGEACPDTPRSLELPPLASESHVIGVLYVLEGATQGGRVIAPLLESRFGFTAGHGARYFNLHRQASWPAFREWMSVRRCRKQDAADAARRTFITLAAHLDAMQRSQPTC